MPSTMASKTLLVTFFVILCTHVSLVRSDCPPGQEKRNELSVCRPCADGYTKPDTGLLCTPCPAGTTQTKEDKTLPCEACPPGSYTPTEGTKACLPCNTSSWQAEAGKSSCDSCPPNSEHGFLGRTSPLPCYCSVGYFAPDKSKPDQCEKCRTGTQCNGNLTHPIAEPGYWVDPTDGTFARNCRPAEACLGGVNNPCKEGYEQGSRFCESCAEDNFRQFVGDRCTACPFKGWGILCIVFIPITVAVVSILVSTYAREPTLSIPYSALTFIQVTSLFAEVNVDYPTALQRILTYFSIFNANPDIFGFECLLDYQQIWALQMSLPVLYVITFYILYQVSKGGKHHFWLRRGANPKDHMIHALLILMCMSQIYLARSTTEILDCTESANGEFWLDSSPDINCTKGTWVHMLAPSIVGTLVYCIGLPLFMLTRIWKCKKLRQQMLDSGESGSIARTQLMYRYGFLVERFRPGAFYWEILTLVYKVLIMFFVKFLSLRPTVVVILILAMTLPFLALHLWVQPHRHRSDNIFEAATIAFECYMALIMLVFHFDAFDRDSYTPVTVVAIVGIVMIVVGGAVYTYLGHIRYKRSQDPSVQDQQPLTTKGAPESDYSSSTSYYSSSDDGLPDERELVSIAPREHGGQ
eukprot:TRINITY_DN588_c0_g4_i1.p1 TRINITY_DN588_c0_g4~~TRINITY_DN588_c0_g4_i1.p1  ORF type:complete len:638 (+),score=75.72 TRINITY_DN588_c0_g4_i1:310-2223(+)